MERINIVGAGLSGLSAAICLAESGRPVNLISAQASERAQSVLAEGGINAALDTMGENDTPEEHFADTMKGGVYLADPNAVEGLALRAPELVKWLARLGALLQMEGGRIIQRNFGGQKKKRTAYAKSSTGKVLMTTLIDAARKYEASGLIARFPHHLFGKLIVREGRCLGALVKDAYSGEAISLPGRVILCSGGLNGFFPGMTTGTTQNTGDVTAMAFHQGAALANLEFIQYHPTTIGIAGKRCLISEAARGEGGRLFVKRGGESWYFMEELYPELKNLMPRDVVSREMARVVKREDCGDQVYLDMTGLPAETWRRKLPDLRAECVHYLALDPAKAPIPVEPGIHFFMGGIDVDIHHRTSIDGLYAAGECACQYHGANRLGGNSMLGAVYGGRVAAEDILAAPEREAGALPEEAMPPIEETGEGARFTKAVSDILLDALGIVRNEADMRAALEKLDALPVPGEREAIRLDLARAMLLSAIHRTESRGAHWRSDYPDKDEAQRKTTLATIRDGEISIEYRDIPERRARA